MLEAPSQRFRSKEVYRVAADFLATRQWYESPVSSRLKSCFGLRCDCGGHFSTASLLSSSGKQFEMISTSWYVSFQLHDTVRYVGASNHHKMGTLWTWWDELWCLTMFLSTKGSKVCQGNAPQTITSPLPTCTVGTRQNGFVISCCLCQIWTYHMNIVAYIKTH